MIRLFNINFFGLLRRFAPRNDELLWLVSHQESCHFFGLLRFARNDVEVA